MSLIPHLVNSVALGLLFALIALGFMLVVNLRETINLAHGSFFALGMYIALLVVAPGGDPLRATFDGYRTLPIGWRYAIALVVAPIALRRTYGRDPLYGLLLTFGAARVVPRVVRRALQPAPGMQSLRKRALPNGERKRPVIGALPAVAQRKARGRPKLSTLTQSYADFANALFAKSAYVQCSRSRAFRVASDSVVRRAPLPRAGFSRRDCQKR